MKKVIDADNQRVLETFDAKDTDRILKKYRNAGKWEDVEVDGDGDIILWEE